MITPAIKLITIGIIGIILLTKDEKDAKVEVDTKTVPTGNKTEIEEVKNDGENGGDGDSGCSGLRQGDEKPFVKTTEMEEKTT